MKYIHPFSFLKKRRSFGEYKTIMIIENKFTYSDLLNLIVDKTRSRDTQLKSNYLITVRHPNSLIITLGKISKILLFIKYNDTL